MIEVRQTPEFAEWIEKLRDRAARLRILQRLVRVGEDHFGDTKALGDGDKDSQQRDIAKARAVAERELLE